ncbi:hypothetical protein DFS34DRAFT_162679 [Phlyctochytrium arcticum]|nr:hypothetical protein DFS34DRAFT_162679 [Phlyctochytrium arcticum]
MEPHEPQEVLPAFEGLTAGVSPETIRNFVRSRLATFHYFIRLYEGQSHFMNTVLISNAILAAMHDDKLKLQRRVTKWFHLGYSIGTILSIPNAIDFVKAFNVLVVEYESSDTTSRKKMKRILSGRIPRGGLSADQVSNLSQEGVYTYLDTPHVPFEIDHVQTVLALFEVLTLAYAKFIESIEARKSPGYVEAIAKIDSKIRKIMTVLMKDLTVAAKNRAKEELDSLLATPPDAQ